MHRVPVPRMPSVRRAALLALVAGVAWLASGAPSRAATVIACQDANGSDWPVSPAHPCPFGTTSTPAAPDYVSQSGVTFTVSAANSTSAQLAAGATFTGTIEAIPNQVGMAILISTDQPGTLTILQCIDAACTYQAPSLVYAVPVGGISQTITANANFTYITFKNVGASTTTTLKIDTQYGTIPAVDSNGAMPVTAGLSASLGIPPTSILTRPANTTAYAGSSATPQLVGSSTTAGSVVVPSFSIKNPGGQAAIPRLTLATNATTGWSGVSVTVTLWTAAPTYSTGDGGTYTVATGNAFERAQYACSMIQRGDGASCNAAAAVGASPVIHPASGALVFWDVQIAGAATPISGQTFTLTPEVWN